MSTAFEDAFMKAGVTRQGNELKKSIALYFSQGGTIEEFDRVVSETRAKMVDVGHAFPEAQVRRADVHQSSYEPGGQPPREALDVFASSAQELNLETGDQLRVATQNRNAPSSPEPDPGGASQTSSEIQDTRARSVREPVTSGEASKSLPEKAKPDVPPAREPASPRRPSPEQRTAALRVGHSSVPTIFQSIRVPELDNAELGEIYSDQLPRIVANSLRRASFYVRLKNYGQPPKPMKLKEYLPGEFVAKVWKESCAIDVTSNLGEGILLSPDGKLSLVKRSA